MNSRTDANSTENSAFIDRGLASAAKAKRCGGYIAAEVVLLKLAMRLQRAKNAGSNVNVSGIDVSGS
ncbi:MAG: hypothetical protein H7232_13435 [Aeromicrobium sp.]|nr:hypothetical protein [Burkholderiales bacterium]